MLPCTCIIVAGMQLICFSSRKILYQHAATDRGSHFALGILKDIIRLLQGHYDNRHNGAASIFESASLKHWMGH